ncbi:hypothetical protein, partial [Synechococcus sp. R3-13]|uniref:hypothetical protein n=1 Tax=Synechococcus sp. R3-13 TaxID=2421316 RepID=UPI0039C38B4A
MSTLSLRKTCATVIETVRDSGTESSACPPLLLPSCFHDPWLVAEFTLTASPEESPQASLP